MRAARRGDPAIYARARRDHPGRAARRGLAASAPARLSCLAQPVRGGPGDPPQRNLRSSCAVMPAVSGSRTRSIIGRAWQPNTTLPAAAAMPRHTSAATATAAPCAPSPTAFCRWPAPCSNSRRCSTPATRFGTPSPREHPPAIPLFDRKRPSLRPDLPPGRAPGAAAVKDADANAAASAEPAQSVLDRASMVLPLPWRSCITGCRAGLTPRSFSLDHWWEVHFLQRRVRRNLRHKFPLEVSNFEQTQLRAGNTV
jgi:hypothetical protein